MLYKRKDSKNWWYAFTLPNGKQTRNSTRSPDKKTAQRIADQAKANSWRPEHLTQNVKWVNAAERWIKEAQKTRINEDKAKLKYLSTFLNHLLIKQITSDVIELIIDARLQEGVSNATVNRYTALVSAILHKCVHPWYYLDKLPHIRKLKEPLHRIRYLTRTEAQALLKQLKPHQQAMVRFSLATGLRQSNVTNLEWSQINKDKTLAWIHADQSKNKASLSIPLNIIATTVLKELEFDHPTRVFTYKGKPINRANTKSFRSAVKRSGIENFKWHDLRHTWASWHRQAGTPCDVLQELGGWKRPDMVQRYAHLGVDHLAEYAKNIEEI